MFLYSDGHPDLLALEEDEDGRGMYVIYIFLKILAPWIHAEEANI